MALSLSPFTIQYRRFLSGPSRGFMLIVIPACYTVKLNRILNVRHSASRHSLFGSTVEDGSLISIVNEKE